jgi:hypothetical protein
MVIDRNLLYEAIKKSIILGIQRTSDDILDKSLRTNECYVPRNTGFLANSGDVILRDSGAEVVYRASYSADIERGREARPFKDGKDVTVTVKPHRVKAYTRKDGTRVEAHTVSGHTKTYKNAKVVGWYPKIPGTKQREPNKIYRVLTQEPALEPTNFLARATADTIPNLILKQLVEGKKF